MLPGRPYWTRTYTSGCPKNMRKEYLRLLGSAENGAAMPSKSKRAIVTTHSRTRPHVGTRKITCATAHHAAS